jgi:hypothetical protein
MAEERNLATVRATDTTETEDVTKEELQRRMEDARESITQTVAEIKDTVTNQYQAVKESVTEALDWREQFRKRPVAFSVGALSVGFIVGYSLAGALVGEDRDDDYGRSYDQDEELLAGRAEAAPASDYSRGEADESFHPSASRSYAAQAITGGPYGSFDPDTASPRKAVPSAPSPASYSSAADEAEEEKGPGLIERFKGSKAYDRLEEEVSALGDRFISELATTAQAVVLPALFNKVKELFGVDLSNKESNARASQQRSSGSANASGGGGTQASSGHEVGSGRREDDSMHGQSATGNQATGGSGSSYATSENRGYGASAGGDLGHGSD